MDGTWVYYSKNRIIIFILVFTFIVVLYFKFENSELYYLLQSKKNPNQFRNVPHVDKFLAFFDHLPTFVDSFYLIKLTFLDYLFF